jgi:hypothetical protein
MSDQSTNPAEAQVLSKAMIVTWRHGKAVRVDIAEADEMVRSCVVRAASDPDRFAFGATGDRLVLVRGDGDGGSLDVYDARIVREGVAE